MYLEWPLHSDVHFCSHVSCQVAHCSLRAVIAVTYFIVFNVYAGFILKSLKHLRLECISCSF